MILVLLVACREDLVCWVFGELEDEFSVEAGRAMPCVVSARDFTDASYIV